jgi:predicted ATPase
LVGREAELAQLDRLFAKAPARQHLEECLSRYDPQQFRNLGSPYDPAVLGLSTLGPVLWLLGYPDQVLAQSEKGLALARELTQQYSVVYAATLVARTRLLRRERQAVQTRIDELITLCEEYGFTSYLALSRIAHGWLLADEGEREEGIQQMCQQLLAWRATGAESARPYYLALLAETYGKAGAPAEGLAVLTECWPWMDKTGGRVFEAELHRVQGELALQKSQVSGPKSPGLPNTPAEAEECFRKAIEIARRQQAKSLELRAVMSLVRLRQQQASQGAGAKNSKRGRALAEARQMLAAACAWFTEGFETKDLQEAKALLEELA